jgi:hypothetical protein
MSLPLVNDRRLGVGVKPPSNAALGGTILPVAAHLISRLSCMLPPVVLSGAGSPLPFSHEVLVGRPASFSINAVRMQRHPTLSEAVQTADQHRVLSALPLKPPTSRIQSNKHGHREPWEGLKLIRRSSGALSQEVHSAGYDCYVPLLCGGDGRRSHLAEGGGSVRVSSFQRARSPTRCT